ncbi:hypothetical protein GKZ68_12700 [Hymenobacter sp. BRD128]|uniref:two-component regulator propeller domain-containing protein n=1 Tax=Hymenobacter sp. BRD128 TaxID=2675878 RepID=UPI001564A597|nr:two-component regulator propeller domain-containing protein [Hymenobacter sp. BRD128]QKG57404.1 hypothetical protein GKZ68_12700 [Hymenobacter sp. BRD128]
MLPRLSSACGLLRGSILVLLLLLQGLRGAGLQARPRPHYALEGHEPPVALLHTGKATFVVTAHGVWQLEGKAFVRKYQSTAQVQCAAAADTVLWLGTRQGVVALGARRFNARPLALPTAAPAGNITALFLDKQGALWVGADGQGVFHQNPDGSLRQELLTPSINDGAVTNDSSIWIATNIGLSRKHGPTWTRYNEEGVANQEIPDNIVNKLLPDNAGNLWVLMSDAISVFERVGHSESQGELPTVKFLGQPGNDVLGVVYLRGEGHLFATSQGLLLLPAAPAISFAPATGTDQIVAKQLLQPVATPAGRPVLAQLDAQQNLWLVSADAVRVLAPKEVHQLLHAPTPTL